MPESESVSPLPVAAEPAQNDGKAKRKAPPHAWKAGQSGNPAGVAKDVDVVGSIRKRSREIIRRLLKAMRGSNDAIAVRAAALLLERAYGGVASAPLDVRPKDGGDPHIPVTYSYKCLACDRAGGTCDYHREKPLPRPTVMVDPENPASVTWTATYVPGVGKESGNA